MRLIVGRHPALVDRRLVFLEHVGHCQALEHA
jgi:hypothetical protein